MVINAIPNCIIFYNATILSTLLAHKENIADPEVSLVSWQHINLHGRYAFTKYQDVIDLHEIIPELIKNSTKGKLSV